VIPFAVSAEIGPEPQALGGNSDRIGNSETASEGGPHQSRFRCRIAGLNTSAGQTSCLFKNDGQDARPTQTIFVSDKNFGICYNISACLPHMPAQRQIRQAGGV
jgi:hypothetical protein